MTTDRHSGAEADVFAVVGGGIVGLALARELLIRRPDAGVTVLEKEAVVGTHQTGHNSGVVHAGLYYTPGSLKARLCARGGKLLRAFCAEEHIEVLECGKLVVASRSEELGRLRQLRERAEANMVPDLRWLSAGEIAGIEPHAVGVAALHSPRTAIVDYGAVARALAADIVRRGGKVLTNAEVTGFRVKGDWVDVQHVAGEERARRAIVCAGLHADRVSALAGDRPEPGIVGFRGEYLRLRPSAAELVRGLIYPVADPRLPFLGIHVTRKIDGTVELGPNAVLALAREGYRRWDVDAQYLAAVLSSRALRSLLWRYRRHALEEVGTSLSVRAYVRRARRLLPELRVADVERAPAGVRAQALGPNGELVDDFVINHLGLVTTVRNAPSPAATSALAIAEHICGELGVPAGRDC